MCPDDNRIVLCCASAYEQKFYFNPLFDKIPKAVKDELQIMCVLFTEEAGGVIMLVFEEDGSLNIETQQAEDDLYYDDVSAGLLIGQIRRNRRELLDQLDLFYRVFVKGEDLSEFDEEEE